MPAQSALSTGAYPSPLPKALTGFYTVSYAATWQDTKVVVTNVWRTTTTIDLGTSSVPALPIGLILATTVAAFGVAFIVWVVATGVLKVRRVGTHE